MHTALAATSATLAEFLEEQLSLVIQPFANGTMEVTLNNPQEMTTNGTEGLSLWLYRVVRDDLVLNQARERIGPTRHRRVPLPVRLHYLATPIVNLDTPGSPGTEQTIIGRVLQTFHDHPLLRGNDLQGDFQGTEVELNVRLESLDLEEITRVWESLERSYQLSVSYEVSVVHIASGLEPVESTPVQVAMPDYAVITESEPG